MNNIEVSVSKLNEIIESRQPAGVFYANDNGIYILALITELVMHGPKIFILKTNVFFG